MAPARLSLVDLPPEILSHIAYLICSSPYGPRRGGKRLRQPLAHSSLYKAFLPHLWHELGIGGWFGDTTIDVPSQATLQKYGPLVKSIAINLQNPIESESGPPVTFTSNEWHAFYLSFSCAMAQVLPLCTSLTSLSISQSHPMVDQDTSSELQGSDQDTSSELQGSLLALLSSMTPYLKNLRRLCATNLFEELISETISELPLLESLSCHGLKEAPDQFLLGHQLSQLKYFKDLHLDDSSDEFIINVISQCPSLEKLVLESLYVPDEPEDHISEAAARSLGWHVSRLKKLTHLELYRMNTLDISWSNHDWSNTLTKFIISGCPGLSALDMPHFFHRVAPNLIHLEFITYHDGLHALSKLELPRLAHLTLCSEVTDDLIYWTKTTQNLREFTLWGARKSDCRSLIRLLSKLHWPKLKRIELSIHEDNCRASRTELQEQCDSRDIVSVVQDYTYESLIKRGSL